MRLGLSAYILVMISCFTTTAYAAEVQTGTLTNVKSELSTQYSALNDANKAITDKTVELSRQKAKLASLVKESKTLNSKLLRSKRRLAEDYAKVDKIPDYDMTASQSAYKKAWAAVNQHQRTILNAKQGIETTKIETVQLQQGKKQIEMQILALQKIRERKRVALLRKEINQSGSEIVSLVNTCRTNMTLDECSKQTTTLALQKAVRTFQTHLLSNATESQLVKTNERAASFNIHVLKYSQTRAEFFGENKFKAILDVSLLAKPAENAACKLLDVDSRYCFSPSVDGPRKTVQKEVPWFKVVVYSNKYKDKVVVDGVSYGSSPAEIMLSKGNHKISVQKEGYKTFEQNVNVTIDQSIRTTLVEQENLAESGEQFADFINKQVKAPPMSVITKGVYKIGENAAKKYKLIHDYSISSAPVTVGQFSAFISATSYKTNAEIAKACSAIKDSNIVSMDGQYWRDPGFKQSSQSPVVCVSQNDAEAYVKWLTKKTGFYYRLPSSNEWEIAARGGSDTDYWWGNEFGAGHANTGWGGTSWSNVSTSPVGAFEPNQFGIFDAVGNVWEWTSGPRGLLRGGAWSFSPEKAKADSELYAAPKFSANFAGFRVVREL